MRKSDVISWQVTFWSAWSLSGKSRCSLSSPMSCVSPSIFYMVNQTRTSVTVRKLFSVFHGLQNKYPLRYFRNERKPNETSNKRTQLLKEVLTDVFTVHKFCTKQEKKFHAPGAGWLSLQSSQRHSPRSFCKTALCPGILCLSTAQVLQFKKLSHFILSVLLIQTKTPGKIWTLFRGIEVAKSQFVAQKNEARSISASGFNCSRACTAGVSLSSSTQNWL